MAGETAKNALSCLRELFLNIYRAISMESVSVVQRLFTLDCLRIPSFLEFIFKL